SERRDAGACLDEKTVAVSVVAALELDYLIAPSEAARETQSRHRRLRPAVDHANHLDRGHGVNNLLGHLDLKLGRRAVARPARERRVQSVNYFRVGVAEYHRPPRADVVNVCATVNVVHRRALRARDEA